MVLYYIMEKKEGKHWGCLPGHDISLGGHNYEQEQINEAKGPNDEMVCFGLNDEAKWLELDDINSEARGVGENPEKRPVADDHVVYNRKTWKRKRARSREQVESQRMTHIAVERNRRKQMNEHLCTLRSLMPSSYVQRGDQASIIGGAIEFVRELEQLVQCLESQKRRRVNGNAEIKSCLADVEVKLLGVDHGSMKILSRSRPGQLIKTIAGLEDLQLHIVHTNVTTIQQTILYSFDFKMNGEALRLTAEDIANSTQKILSNFISTITLNNVLDY